MTRNASHIGGDIRRLRHPGHICIPAKTGETGSGHPVGDGCQRSCYTTLCVLHKSDTSHTIDMWALIEHRGCCICGRALCALSLGSRVLHGSRVWLRRCCW